MPPAKASAYFEPLDEGSYYRVFLRLWKRQEIFGRLERKISPS